MINEVCTGEVPGMQEHLRLHEVCVVFMKITYLDTTCMYKTNLIACFIFQY